MINAENKDKQQAVNTAPSKGGEEERRREGVFLFIYLFMRVFIFYFLHSFEYVLLRVMH